MELNPQAYDCKMNTEPQQVQSNPLGASLLLLDLNDVT